MLVEINKEGNGLRIEKKQIYNGALKTEKIFIIEENEPYVLWDLFYDALGFPPRRREEAVVDAAMIEKDSLEDKLVSMSARDIIKKVEEDTGVRITVSVKSKKNVIRHALEAYAMKETPKPCSEYIPLEKCKEGHLYRIEARNGRFGVFRKEESAFTIARKKFNDIFLFDEYHWDTGEPFGTVKPKRDLGRLVGEPLKDNDALLDHLKGLERYETPD